MRSVRVAVTLALTLALAGAAAASCDGLPFGRELDECGVCGGDGSSCVGCDGVPNSGLVLDACGACGGNATTSSGCRPVTADQMIVVGATYILVTGQQLEFTVNFCLLDGVPCVGGFATSLGGGTYRLLFSALQGLSVGQSLTVRTGVTLLVRPFVSDTITIPLRPLHPRPNQAGVFYALFANGNVTIEDGATIDVSGMGYGGGGGGTGERDEAACDDTWEFPGGGVALGPVGGGLPRNSSVVASTTVFDTCGLYQLGGDGGGSGGSSGRGSYANNPNALGGGRGFGSFGGVGGRYVSSNGRCNIDGSPAASGANGQKGGYLFMGTNGEIGTVHNTIGTATVYIGSGGGGGSGGRAALPCLTSACSACCGFGLGGEGGAPLDGLGIAQGCGSGRGGSGGAAGGGAVVIYGNNVNFFGKIYADGAGDGSSDRGYGAGGGVLLFATRLVAVGPSAQIFSRGGGVALDNGGSVKIRATTYLPSAPAVAAVASGRAGAVSVCTGTTCVGCDGVFSSPPALYDTCGVCNGNGTTCLVCSGGVYPAVPVFPSDVAGYTNERVTVPFTVYVPKTCSGRLRHVFTVRNGNDNVVLTIDTYSPRLVLEPYELAPGTYTVTLELVSPGQFDIRLPHKMGLRMIKPNIVVRASPAGSALDVPADRPFTLNLTESFNPAASLPADQRDISCSFTCCVGVGSCLPCSNLLPDGSCALRIGSSFLQELVSGGQPLNVNAQVTSPSASAPATYSTSLNLRATLAYTVAINQVNAGPYGTTGVDVPVVLQTVLSGTAVAPVRFAWSCSMSSECPSMANPTLFTSPVNASLLAVPAGVFTANAGDVLFTVTVTDGSAQAAVTASALVRFSPPPTGNNLYTNVNPSNTVSLALNNWYNASYSTPMLYNFGFALGDDVAYSAPSPAIIWLSARPGTQAYFVTTPKLAPGTYTFFGVVTADYFVGAPTSVVTTATATIGGSAPSTPAQVFAFLQGSFAALAQAQAQSDSAAVAAQAQLLLQQLNTADPATLTPAERATATSLREQLISAIVSSTDPSDPAAVAQALGALAMGTSVPSQISDDAFAALVDFLSAAGPSANTPAAAQSLVGVIDGLLLSRLPVPPATVGSFNASAYTNTTIGLSRNDSLALQESLRECLHALTETLVCGESPVTLEGQAIRAAVQSVESAAGLDLGLGGGAVSLGSTFNTGTCDSYQYVEQNFNPNSFAAGTGNWTILTTVVTLEFYNEGGALVAVNGLNETSAVTLSFPYADARNPNVTCVFWNVATLAWLQAGCTKSPLTTDDLLVCTCTHLTQFSIGQLTIQINTIIIPTQINFQSKGLIAAWSTLGALVGVYILLAIFAIYKDRQRALAARKPSSEEVVLFIHKVYTLYQQPVPARVLTTHHLDDWKEAYGYHFWPNGTKLTFWQKVKMAVRFGFRYNHNYVSIFFPPLSMSSRLARATVTMSMLFVNLAISAVFFQYTTNSFDPESIGLKIIVGFLTSIITFVPFAAVQFMFKHVDAEREYNEKARKAFVLELESLRTSTMSLDLTKVQLNDDSNAPITGDAKSAHDITIRRSSTVHTVKSSTSVPESLSDKGTAPARAEVAASAQPVKSSTSVAESLSETGKPASVVSGSMDLLSPSHATLRGRSGRPRSKSPSVASDLKDAGAGEASVPEGDKAKKRKAKRADGDKAHDDDADAMPALASADEGQPSAGDGSTQTRKRSSKKRASRPVSTISAGSGDSTARPAPESPVDGAPSFVLHVDESVTGGNSSNGAPSMVRVESFTNVAALGRNDTVSSKKSGSTLERNDTVASKASSAALNPGSGGKVAPAASGDVEAGEKKPKLEEMVSVGFLDFLMPFWVEYILYVLTFLLAIAGFVVTALYGVSADAIDPTNQLTIAWIESFLIAVAVNVLLLQTMQAIIGTLLTTLIGSITTLGTALALLIGSAAINMQGN